MFALTTLPPRPKQYKYRAYWEGRRSIRNSFLLQHSSRFLRTLSMGSLVPVVIQLKKKWTSDNKRISKRQTQITVPFSASIISCITQLIIACVCRPHFLRFQKPDGSVRNVCCTKATKKLSFM